MHRRPYALALAALLLPCIPAVSADWSAFRGPNNDGTTPEKVAWPASGAKPLWRVPVGEGFGTVAVGGGKVFLTAKGGNQEALLALDEKTGAAKWHMVLGETTNDHDGGPGPRTTPAVSGKLVYALSTYLNLAACDVETGSLVWGHDLAAEFGAKSQFNAIDLKNWGSATSPIVDGNAVFVYGGGKGATFLAFDKTTGKVLWKTGDEQITHASPTVATILGVRQVLFLTKAGLISLATADGKELWRYPFTFNTSTASTPVVGGKDGDLVYCSAGYNVGAGAARITKAGDKFKATEIWRDKDPEKLVNHWTTPVHKDGYLYGIYGFKKWGTAPLKCVEMATGKVMWEKPGFGPGGTILAGDDLVVQGDAGQVAFVKAKPDKYTPVGGGVIIDSGKSWNAAVVSGGRLYTRTAKKNGSNKEQGYLACLEVGAK